MTTIPPTGNVFDNTLAEAVTRHQQGDLDGALEIYRRLIDSESTQPDPWHLSGAIAYQRGKNALAQRLIEQAIELNGEVADYHNNLGLTLGAQSNDAGAVAAFERALSLDKGHTKALLNLGGLERRQGNLAAALALGRRAVESAPDNRDTHNNLGNALKDAGFVDEAITVYRQGIEIDPDFALAHWNLAISLLLAGEFREGFEELRWRWRWDGFPGVRRNFAVPQWSGEENLAGRTILLYGEQGLGDTIQFLRYARCLAECDADVIVELPASMVPLAAGVGIEIVKEGFDLPPFDFHASLLDVPAALGTSSATDIPAPKDYLTVPPDVARRWRDRLASARGLNVGLNWYGNSESPVEKFRCLPMTEFAGLAVMANVNWYSLQKGEEALTPPEFPMIDTGVEPLVETAGLISQLDLVITSDTAVAHLAAALGRPTWVLLHAAPDWRWGMAGDACHWYPSVRLFRQPKFGDWKAVAESVRLVFQEFRRTLAV